MNSKLLLLLTIGLTGVALSVGCGWDDDAPAPTTAPKAEKDAAPAAEAAAERAPSEAPQPLAGDVVEQLRATIEIPSYYPEDGPVYPGAKPSQAQQSTNGRVSLVFGTEAMPTEASSVMNEAAEAKGWTILTEDRIERGLLTQAEKDGRKMMILTSRMDGGSDEPMTLVAVSVDP